MMTIFPRSTLRPTRTGLRQPRQTEKFCWVGNGWAIGRSRRCGRRSRPSSGTRSIYLSKTDWTAKDFLPYVAYLDKSAAHKPLDWFYDSYLFLAYGGAPSGKQYIDGATNKADWEYYFDNLLFCQDRSLHALQTCLRQVEGQLGPRGRKINRKILGRCGSPIDQFRRLDRQGSGGRGPVHPRTCVSGHRGR